jgi:uncharacterized surface protein with fasciclin (FAS1) repeats
MDYINKCTLFTASIEVVDKSDKLVKMIVYPKTRVLSIDGNEVKSISSSNTEEISQKIGVFSGCEDIARLFSSYDYQVVISTENDGEKVGKVSSLKPFMKNGESALEVEISTKLYQGTGATAKNALSFRKLSNKENVTLTFTSHYPSLKLSDILESDLENFSILSTAVKAADLENDQRVQGLFEGTKNYTVFTPTNAAFEKLPSGTVENLLKPEKKSILRNLLEDHIFSGILSAADIMKKKSIKAVSGKRLKIRVEDDRVYVGNARVVTGNVPLAHGYAHVINRVLQ